jgi:hypothetical protein
MTKPQGYRTALVLAIALSTGTQGAFAQNAATSCEGLTIVSLEPSDASSAIDGELTTFNFDMTATVENAGDAALSLEAPLTLTLASGEEVLETLAVTELGAGEQVTLTTEATKWSPYTNYGFEISIVSNGMSASTETPARDEVAKDACKLSIDSSELEQALRGH